MMRALKTDLREGVLVTVIVLLALPFAIYAIGRGGDLWDPLEQSTSRLFHGDARGSTLAIYGHMIAGGAITVLAPLQLLQPVRRRLAWLHRALGYMLVTLACVTSLGGLAYIALQGTIGGPVMDAGFALYGVLMILSALCAVHFARVRDPKHALWAQRLVILALASWLYRVHYGIWEVLTGGAGSAPDFSGPFDLVQVFAFYLPYLMVHALWWHARGRGDAPLR